MSMSLDHPRVAILAVHTSPIDQPGTGDSGGMNVYIRSVAERLAGAGVAVDVFTRCRGGETHEVREIAPAIRVVSAKGGPCAPVLKSAVQRYLPEFLGGVLRVAREDGNRYDLIHSHYWLSGWVGRAAKDLLEAPLVASFHTLGKVKNYSLARGESPEPPIRLRDEQALIDEADRILAPSRSESFGLVALEAQACGTPVVASAVGGLRTVVRRGGLLVEGHDPGDHAEALLSILRDPELATRLGAEGARGALAFSWDATTQQVASV